MPDLFHSRTLSSRMERFNPILLLSPNIPMSTTKDRLPAPDALSLADKMAANIRQQLVNGELLPGQRLSESELSEKLGISRNTLREVFRILIKEGLLKHEPNKGVSVSTPSIASIIDIYRVRRMIECQALLQAYPRHPAHARIREAVEHAQAAVKRNDWLAVGTANIEFHAAIVALADSERLNALYVDVAAELRLAFGLVDDREYLHSPYVEQNAQLLELITQGQLNKAAQMLEQYLIQSERMLLAVYARLIA